MNGGRKVTGSIVQKSEGNRDPGPGAWSLYEQLPVREDSDGWNVGVGDLDRGNSVSSVSSPTFKLDLTFL